MNDMWFLALSGWVCAAFNAAALSKPKWLFAGYGLIIGVLVGLRIVEAFK